MSLRAYEDACTRAELFGQPVPDKEDFLAKHKHLDIVEFEEIEIRTAAENTAMLDDSLRGASSGIGELNTILASTQTKINKLKGVCGSLTSFFRTKLTSSKDNLSYSSDPSYVGQSNYDKDTATSTADHGCTSESLCPGNETPLKKMSPQTAREGKPTENQNGGDINSALQDLQEMERDDLTVLKSSVKDVGDKVTSQMSKLDRLICQADKAESSMQHQNKQMRSFLQ